MVGPRYSTESLLALRESPLIVKPDGLPSIEQWLEYVEEEFLLRAIIDVLFL